MNFAIFLRKSFLQNTFKNTFPFRAPPVAASDMPKQNLIITYSGPYECQNSEEGTVSAMIKSLPKKTVEENFEI